MYIAAAKPNSECLLKLSGGAAGSQTVRPLHVSIAPQPKQTDNIPHTPLITFYIILVLHLGAPPGAARLRDNVPPRQFSDDPPGGGRDSIFCHGGRPSLKVCDVITL